jgi:hypothetical protein
LKWNELSLFPKKARSKQKNELAEVKRTEAAYAQAGLYNNPIPARFLAPLDFSKLLKRLQIRAQATLDSGIGSLESIPGLLKHLQIRAQATLDSRIGSLESIPRLHNLKYEDEDNFFWIEIYSSLNIRS